MVVEMSYSVHYSALVYFGFFCLREVATNLDGESKRNSAKGW